MGVRRCGKIGLEGVGLLFRVWPGTQQYHASTIIS